MPRFISRDRKHVDDLEGVILSVSNATINCDGQKCRRIFIGHGTGDKKYGSNPRILEGYDYHFLSGPKHLEKLRDVGLDIPNEKLVEIGNLRFDDYVNGTIDREQELDRIGIVDRTRKNILYAPTWKWGNGTLHKYVHRFAREITKEHNLIVRPHHHDRIHIPRIRLWAKLNGIRHVYFSNPAEIVRSDTMQDFAVSDILISDTSSILYEYLITRNPIIVAKNEYGDLHHMPDGMNIMTAVSVYDGTQSILRMLEENLRGAASKEKYERLLNNCFYFNDGESVTRAVSFIESLL
jgi:CDP-glycerol glycerophosphotransferase (TagB/SpsB family)